MNKRARLFCALVALVLLGVFLYGCATAPGTTIDWTGGDSAWDAAVYLGDVGELASLYKYSEPGVTCYIVVDTYGNDSGQPAIDCTP